MRLGTGGRTEILAGINGCWSYDGFGNRKSEAMSTALCTANPPLASWATYNTTNNNRMDATNQNANQVDGYDAAGNVLNDGVNRYLYDPEGRLCAVQFQVSGTVTAYLCDAEGRRVGKGTLPSWPSSCNAPTAANGFASASQYLLGMGNEQVTELNGAGAWQHTNVFADGRLAATYNASGLHFALSDPLGTKRVQATVSATGAGAPDLNCLSLPFGNSPGNSLGTGCVAVGSGGSDATEHHFTGKERDTESGNDYFGARYYASSMGRFMSPDPSQLYYADPSNPQSFNLYSYGQNNPLINIDPTGMDCIHVNVDTGKYEGFERGDCDNSTEEKANSGQYVDGTVSSITTSTGDANGVVRGYGGTNDDTGALISGTFASPLDAPLQQIPQIDPDEQRIDALVQGVATDTASMPWVCNASVILQAQIPSTPLSVGVTADRNGVSPSAKVSKTGPNGGVAVTTNGKKVGYQIVAPVTPFVNATLSTGQNQATVGVSKQYKFGPGNVSAGASLTFGYLGDSHCR